MTAVALAGLAGLALVDSTSFGTLVLPLMMLLAPQVRTRNLVVYLATIAAFYFAVGVALLAGARAADRGDRPGAGDHARVRRPARPRRRSVRPVLRDRPEGGRETAGAARSAAEGARRVAAARSRTRRGDRHRDGRGAAGRPGRGRLDAALPRRGRHPGRRRTPDRRRRSPSWPATCW